MQPPWPTRLYFLFFLFQNSIEDHAPVFLATSHPHIDEDGTVWNIGTTHHKKSGFVYSVFKFEPKSSEEGEKLRPWWSFLKLLS